MIQEKRDGDVSMHKMLLELLYEMSRIQRVRLEELCKFCEERNSGENRQCLFFFGVIG